MAKSRKEIQRFQWWLDNPDRIPAPARKKLDDGDLEEHFTIWTNAFEKLEKQVSKIRVVPVAIQLTVAFSCLLFLLLPDARVGMWGGVIGVVLVIAPPIFGAWLIWFCTAREREFERTCATNAKSLILP